jgi:Na+/melibiose symporter-like transporter
VEAGRIPLFGYGTVFFLAVSIVLAWLYPMTRERHDALRECLRLKKEGKKPDETDIRELL